MDQYSPHLQQKIHSLSVSSVKETEIQELWAEILEFYFPTTKDSFFTGSRYLREVSPSLKSPFVHMAIHNNRGMYPGIPFLVLQCMSTPNNGASLPSLQTDRILKDKLMESVDSMQRCDGLEIHGILIHGPHVRFYALIANDVSGCGLWNGDHRLHIVDDHDTIADHLAEIKSSWLSAYALDGDPLDDTFVDDLLGASDVIVSSSRKDSGGKCGVVDRVWF